MSDPLMASAFDDLDAAEQLRAEREAIQAEAAGNGAAEDEAESDAPRFRIVSDRVYEQQPVRSMLIDGILEAGGTALLYGSPDSSRRLSHWTQTTASRSALTSTGTLRRRARAMNIARCDCSKRAGTP